MYGLKEIGLKEFDMDRLLIDDALTSSAVSGLAVVSFKFASASSSVAWQRLKVNSCLCLRQRHRHNRHRRGSRKGQTLEGPQEMRQLALRKKEKKLNRLTVLLQMINQHHFGGHEVGYRWAER
jgi:hypothetical protein